MNCQATFKKHSKRFLLILYFFILRYAPSLAYDFSANNLYFNIISENEVEVTYVDLNYNSDFYYGNVIIPARVTYNNVIYNVTHIGEYAFQGCHNIKSVSIPETIVHLGSGCFWGCVSLENIIIPQSVTIMEDECLSNCFSLKSITIPQGVRKIGVAAFGYCPQLAKIVVERGNSVYDSRNNCNAIIETNSNTLISGCKNTIIPNGISAIGERAFSYCRNLAYLTLPEGVTHIGNASFVGCINLLSITFPRSVVSIGNYAFAYSNLRSVVIPASITSISSNSFAGCENIESIYVERGNTKYDSRNNCNAIIESNTNSLICGCKNTIIPYGVTSINDEAFMECYGLTFIAIPNTVTSIKKNVFACCTNLASVVLPSSITSIGDYAFASCVSLTSINLPNSVESIGERAFNQCNNLEVINVETDNPKYDSRGNCNAIIETESNTLVVGCKNTIIPNTVASIADYAFSGCSGLTSIYFPNNIITIGSFAFSGCSGLKELNLPSHITSIGSYAFWGCNNLEKVIIPKTINTIGYSAFWGCDNLHSVTVKSANPIRLHEDVFSSQASATLYVPLGSKAMYAKANVWKRFKDIVEINIQSPAIDFADAEVKRICVENWDADGDGELSYDEAAAVTDLGEAFKSNTEISTFNELEYFTGLTSIGGWAFYECSNLASVIIPQSVTSLSANAFRSCRQLQSIVIPTCVSSIESSSFGGCSGLHYIKVDEHNTKYDSRENCNAIIETETNTLIAGCYSTKIPYGVVVIGETSFYECSNLYEIAIPSSVTTIKKGAFWECSNLATIDIPEGVTTIEYGAFWKCYGLTTIKISKSVSSIDFEGYGGLFLPFASYPNLTRVEVEEGNEVYDSRNNCNAIIESSTNTLMLGCKNTIIPNTIVAIDSYAFCGCTTLTEIEIPSSVTSIGFASFASCNNLSTVTVHIKEPLEINSNAFSNRANATLYVPYGCKAAYENAEGWKDFKEIIELDKEEEPGEVEVTDVAQLDNAIYIAPLEALTGSGVTATVCLKNAGEVGGYSFDLILPEGVSIAKNAKNKFTATLIDDRHDEHSLSVNYADGYYSLAVLSLGGGELSGNDGGVISLPLEVSSDMQEDTYPIEIRNVKFSTPAAVSVSVPNTTTSITVTDVQLGDVNRDGQVDIADAIGIVNKVVRKESAVFIEKAADVNGDSQIDIADAIAIVNIVVRKTNNARMMHRAPALQASGTPTKNTLSVEGITVPQGGQAAMTVQFQFAEADLFSGFQFDLALPEGLSLQMNNGKVVYSKGDCYEDTHQITANYVEAEQVYAFGCLSLESDPLVGTQGTLLTLTLEADASLPVGTVLKGTLRNIAMGTVQAQSVAFDAVEFTVTIGEPDDGRLKFYETATALPQYTAGSKADVTVQRTIKAGEWSTLVLPFNLTLANAKAAFGDDVQLAKYNGYTIDYGEDEDNITPLGIVIKLADYQIPARGNLKGGTPVLIKTSRDITEFQLDNVTLTEGVTDEQKADDDYDLAGRLTGSLVKTTIPADGLFVSNNQFWYSTGKTNVKAFRCWFELGAVLNEETDFGARVVLHFDDSEASAVQEVAIPSQHPQWLYDLQGRRVEKTARKGLYIKDGKKVLVK